MHVNRIPIYL